MFSIALPLNGVRVLDLTRALAGPFCTMILGDLGADVVKVEPAPDGDMIRGWGPFDRGVSTYYLSSNRNKRSLAVNFRSTEGLDLIRSCAATCDVVVENFKPGATAAMGLDYEHLSADNPGLVYASVSAFGSGGPAGEWPGLDQIAQAYSGFMSVTGTEESGPLRVGVAIGDLTAGMWCAMGVLAALLERKTSQRGQRVETSLLAGLIGLLSVQGQRYLSLGEVPTPAGNAHPVIAPYGAFAAADGDFILAAATPQMWTRLCALLGLAQLERDPRFADGSARLRNREELKAALEVRLRAAPRKEWIGKLIDAGIPAGPINSMQDVFNDAQVAHCGLIETAEHPSLGLIRQLANPIGMPAMKGNSVRSAPPLLGQHSVEILEGFGIDRGRIQTLLEDGVIVQGAAACLAR